jgi:hypothetical protein
MCDPLTIIGALGALAGPLLSKPPKPPTPAVPAAPAPNARAAGATVQLGTGPADQTSHLTGATQNSFVEKRKAGTSLGGLGRSSLTI